MTERVAGHQFTLRQLKIFWTVAQTRSLTRAAKQLDVRQPSISQQLSRMEHAVGGKLMKITNTELRLTPAGEYLLAEASTILGAVDRVSAGLNAYFEGERGVVVVGALPSLARNLLAPTFARLRERHPGYTLDIVETTPREARDQLNGRILDAALVSEFEAPGGELRVSHVARDRQLLAVPSTMADLGAVVDPSRDLCGTDYALLRRTVRYAFGSPHTDRVNAWIETLVPGAELAMRCRTYESALAFVEAGLAVALVPEFAARQDGRALFDVTLYETPFPERQTVLMMANQSARLPSLTALEAALREAVAAAATFEVRPVPPFAAKNLAPATTRPERSSPDDVPLAARP